MPPGAGYPIEDFLEAITAQLDQTQDALRLKAVNRPLTFALKDFNVALKVFVEMDAQGRVTFRPAGPNEDGASTVTIAFTTITRPMIEENTISMEMAQAPTLGELGLAGEEQRQLAKIGVRNAAQLKNLQRNAGEDTLSRHTGVDLGRIRGALDLARPRIEDVVADPPSAPVPPSPGWHGKLPGMVRPVLPDAPVLHQPAPNGGVLADRLRQGLVRPTEPDASDARRRMTIAPDAPSLRIGGRNLVEGSRMPSARLDGQPLPLLRADSLAASFALPAGHAGGQLVIELPDGGTESFQLVTRQEPGALQ